MKMRLWGGIGIVLVGCVAAMACVSYGYHETVSMGTTAPAVVRPGGWDQPFYDDLAPYGRWVHVSGPGWVWSPYSVQADWRPYRLGHWVFTDYGWTWASDEEWGWAVYHYGRWHLDPSYGWVWVPGTEWGPAWVAWHEGGGYVGWAPLPWQVRFRADVGLDWGGAGVTIEPSWWCFASARYLVDPGLRTHIVPPARNVTLIRVTQNVTNYTYIDNRIVNQGVKVERIGRAVGHAIPRYRVQQADAPETTRGGKVRGNEFIVFRPDTPRGRDSQGRVDPPGHDEKERLRDLREAAERAEQPSAPVAEQPAETREEAKPKPAPPARPTSNPHSKSRGRRILDELMGTEASGQSPPNAIPPRPQKPDQGSAPSSPTEARQNSPASAGDQPTAATPPAATTPPSTTTPPARQAPSKGHPANEQSARDKAKAARDAATKGRKPKPEAEKPKDSDSNEPKRDKPESE